MSWLLSSFWIIYQKRKFSICGVHFETIIFVLTHYSPQKIWEYKIRSETSQWKQYIGKIFYPQNIENMNLSGVSPGIFGRISPMTSQWCNKQMTLMQFVLWGINILTNKGNRIFCKMAKLVVVPKALNIKPQPEKSFISRSISYFSHVLIIPWECKKLSLESWKISLSWPCCDNILQIAV